MAHGASSQTGLTKPASAGSLARTLGVASKRRGRSRVPAVVPSEGAEVGVFVARQEGSVRLSPLLQKELEDALDEADREDGISAEELFAELRKYG